jgi:hypothetical protein
MNTTNYAPLWGKLSSILAAALELERDRIGREQADIVAEFINHNEFGLAHDQLIDALSDINLIPLEETGNLLTQAANHMGKDA